MDIQISEAKPGATLLVKVAHFPRWQAEAEGRILPIQMNEYGLMTLSLPPGSYQLSLRYGAAWPERVGGSISLVTVILAASLLLYRYDPRPQWFMKPLRSFLNR
jgi:hypothetical protein